jgi:hypothetical protein
MIGLKLRVRGFVTEFQSAKISGLGISVTQNGGPSFKKAHRFSQMPVAPFNVLKPAPSFWARPTIPSGYLTMNLVPVIALSKIHGQRLAIVARMQYYCRYRPATSLIRDSPILIDFCERRQMTKFKFDTNFPTEDVMA